MSPTFWAGTNNGTVFVFTITIPSGQRRTEEDVTSQLGKEIQLKHRAPVIAISVLDGANVPLPEAFEVTKGVRKPPDTSSPHRVVICSEEQFKIFTLPSLKPFCKFKLTAHEGSRVRRVGFAQFTTSRPDVAVQHTESCLLSLTNLGDCIVLSVPELRRQLNAAVIRREDINGISSLTFTRNGEAFYLHSPSELQRITLSASSVTHPRCRIELPEGARRGPSDKVEEEVVEDEEGKIEGRESAAPSPSAQELQSAPPTVNGDTDHTDESEPRVEEPEEPKENGTDEDRHDISALSVGDITIDSVKDHLISSVVEDNRITELKTERLELSSRTESQSVVVRTTVINSSETTVVNTNTSNSGDIAVVELPQADGQPTTQILNEINLRKAPLAKMEDLETEVTAQM